MEAGPERDGKPQRVQEQTETRVEVERAEGCLAGYSAQDGGHRGGRRGVKGAGRTQAHGPFILQEARDFGVGPFHSVEGEALLRVLGQLLSHSMRSHGPQEGAGNSGGNLRSKVPKLPWPVW